MEVVERQSRLLDAVAGRWQIPLLATALAAFGAGIARLALSGESATFAQKLEKIDILVAEGAHTRANAYVIYLMKDMDLPDEQRAELHRRLVGITYRVEASQRRHSTENRLGIITNFKSAVALGAEPDGNDWFALANAYEWSDRPREAVLAYRRAIAEGVSRADAVHRRLVTLAEVAGRPMSAESLLDLDSILADASSTPVNYLWAMEKRASWLLEQGRVDEAMGLVEDAKQRLAGTSEAPAVAYSEALCLRARGELAAAEATLVQLHAEWPAQDELWGRSGWLLGQLNRDAGRDEAALSIYEGILASFVDGPVHDACALGRAECLIALSRPELALDEFGELAADVRSGRTRYIDEANLGETIARQGVSLQKDGRDALAVRYLELAATLMTHTPASERAVLLGRIATSYERLARGADAAADGAEAAPIVPYLRRAAELHRDAATLLVADVDAAAESLARASAAFDEAGILPAAVETLEELVSRYPANPNRAEAMLRLGRTYQAMQRHRDAVRVYDELVAGYPRWPESLAALNPLADSLMRLGGDAAERGVGLLTSIVDDTGPDPVFTPDATEYRDALYALATHLAQAPSPVDEASAERTQARLVAAIARIGDALVLYPEDPMAARLEFLRAECLRRTARMMLDNEKTAQKPAVQDESARRIAMALDGYQRVRELLAGRDEGDLSALEQTYLRASYVYIADCLFDLRAYGDAVEAYREAAWRYENDPIAVAAAMQVAHCYYRLGEPAESRAALGRMRRLVQKLPAEAFESRVGMSPKSYWLALLERMERTGV